MVANGLAGFLEPTDEELDDAWGSVADRVDPSVGRQVNFIPSEVVVCLCAMRIVDHSRFGSSSATRAPFPVPELARLFRRPNTSILAKMANLDGSRPNGGRFDREVFDTLTADPDALDVLYARILRAARRQGFGPDLLPDFLELLDDVESTETVDDPADDAATASHGSVLWFTGIDGEVIVDATHVWITRERVSDYPFPTSPRRAPRSAVRACTVLPPRRDEADGAVHIRVEGCGDLPDNFSAHPDVVYFGPGRRAEFESLAALLNPGPLPEQPMTLRDDFLEALDRLEGVATAQEILDSVAAANGAAGDIGRMEQMADELDALDDDPCLTWAWMGTAWVAVGGVHPEPEERRIDLVRAVEQIVTISGDTGVSALVAAIAGTPLEKLSRPRLAELWEAVHTGDSERRDGTIVSDGAPRSVTSPSVTPDREVALAVALPSAVATVPARPSDVPLESVRVQPASPPNPKANADTAVIRNAQVGSSWRVYLDWAGFRTIAVCDPITGATEIAKGELEGRRFPGPAAAAAAVIERIEPGAVPPVDGWTSWTLDDGTSRPLDAVRGVAVPTPQPRRQPETVPSNAGPSTATTADRGIAWFIEQVRDRGASATRVTGTRRTAVRVTVRGHDPVVVRVKTRTDGTWQASKTDEDPRTDDTGAGFWAFVDLWLSPPAVFILPSKDVADGIRRATDAWVARDPSRQRTGHHAIEPARVRYGRDRWDLLGLFR
ncbi:conserved hypothetical protein [Rhodococcus sp. RD6.2]|uniref:hypothetical protein n=1 Tax=Rhodococcus sp. RD6.2 TaxID=260936 RepID=UPI00063B7CFD|nr:hypothetical protein [Rhodococcus sp. RD6.2]CRK50446.1 conserved hypothetical protein [Rhodococcus sp. RD6.2]